MMDSREAVWTRWTGAAWRDLRLAARTLLRNPGFTATAVATLALAIGANTAIFSLINFTLLEPLPYPDPDGIVQFWLATPGGRGLTLSLPEINTLAGEAALFENVAAYDFGGPGVTVTGTGEPEQVKAIHVSAPYFRLFGASTVVGRTFTGEEDAPRAGRFVVLSHQLWTRRFGADPGLAGKAISLGGEPYTVVGVLAQEFRPDPPAEIWLPLQADPGTISQAHYLRAAGRLRPGVTLDQANARLKLVMAEFRRRFPLFNPKAAFEIKPFRETRTGDLKPAFLVLSGTVILVLLIACSNVANLLLARAAARRHEIAVRAAIGASRGRLAAELLAECLWIAAAGGILGLAAGRAALDALVALHPGAVPGGPEFAAAPLDLRVLAFTAAVSLGAMLICGLLPAFGASKVNLAAVIHEGGSRTGAGRAAVRARSLLVTAQVALAVMLVVGAGLMIRSLAALRRVEPGIQPERILPSRCRSRARGSTTPHR